jgi:hypothetical protein
MAGHKTGPFTGGVTSGRYAGDIAVLALDLGLTAQSMSSGASVISGATT